MNHFFFKPKFAHLFFLYPTLGPRGYFGKERLGYMPRSGRGNKVNVYKIKEQGGGAAVCKQTKGPDHKANCCDVLPELHQIL